MAFGLVSNNSTYNYNYQEFVCDAPADISKLPKDSAHQKTIITLVQQLVKLLLQAAH